MQFSIIYLMGIMYVGSAKHMNNMNNLYEYIYEYRYYTFARGVDLFIQCAR